MEYRERLKLILNTGENLLVAIFISMEAILLSRSQVERLAFG